jgi:hypothetical protein
MMAGSAAVLMMAGAGSARAVAPVDGAVAPETRGRSIDARSDVRSDPATIDGGNPALAPRVTGDDRSGFVTHDELTRFRDALLEQLALERNEQHPAPTFTDAG